MIKWNFYHSFLKKSFHHFDVIIKGFISCFSPKRLERNSRAKYDGEGLDKETGQDICDCLIENCPGCWMDCPTCGSRKCGPECRLYRRYRYEHVDIEGTKR